MYRNIKRVTHIQRKFYYFILFIVSVLLAFRGWWFDIPIYLFENLVFDKIAQWIDKKFQITETLEDDPYDKKALFYSIIILLILWIGRVYLIWSHLYMKPIFFDYAIVHNF